MNVVYKYPMPNPNEVVILPLPREITFLAIDVQGDQAVMWALVDKDHKEDLQDFEFYTVGTGWTIGKDFTYLGTWFSGSFVWHTFYRRK